MKTQRSTDAVLLSRARLLAGVLLASLWAPPALAQDALGDGRGLDAGLGSSRYNASRPDPRREMQFRNSIVTGNAPGGLSFRGDVGYTAPGEFRADLGSNQLFAFRRDSSYSGLIGQGVRGTEGLQYQFALTTGGALPSELIGPVTVSRSGAGITGGEVRQGQTAASPDGSLRGTLRSSASYLSNMSLQPTIIHRTPTSPEDPDIALTASPLRGMRLTVIPPEGGLDMGEATLDDAFDANSRTASERIQRRDPRAASGEQAQRLPTVHEALVTGLLAEPIDSAAVDTSVPATGVADTGAIPGDNRIPGDDPIPAEGAIPGGDPIVAPTDSDGAIPGPAAGTFDPFELKRGAEIDREELESFLTDLRTRMFGDLTPEETDRFAEGFPDLDELERLGVFDQKTIDVLRLNTRRYGSLIERREGPSRSPYEEHMRTGQVLLAQGRFFDAEERFTRAVAIRENDVSAQVGRINAQLGAGLFVSAATNLRSILAQNPELVALEFEDTLIPTGARASAIRTRLRQIVGLDRVPGQERRELDPQLRREGALLLAYFGRQIGDAAMVRDGLGVLREVTAGGDPELETLDRRLLELLVRVWLPGPGG